MSRLTERDRRCAETRNPRTATDPGTPLAIHCIDEPASALTSQVAALASDASAALGARIAFDAADVHVDDRYCGPGYGVMTNLEREAIRLFARTEGILLDPVYTGRAAGGMLDLIRRGFFPSDARILFWHTGGQPALFAEPYRSTLSETPIGHESEAG